MPTDNDLSGIGGNSMETMNDTLAPKGIRDCKDVRASHWFGIKVNSNYADFVLGPILKFSRG